MNETIQEIAQQDYKYGFVTDIEADVVPPGLNEDIVRMISLKKDEPEWMLEWRLKAFRHWLTMKEPTWANVHYPTDRLSGDRATTRRRSRRRSSNSLDEVDPELLRDVREARHLAGRAEAPVRRRRRRGVRQRVGRDDIQGEAGEAGNHLLLVLRSGAESSRAGRKYLGSVVPYTDNFFATLNSAVFSDGSFCYIPKGVRCPMELSTYFRINAANTGQFERTLIIADEGAYVSYLEGCTAPMRDENQLHAAVVELVALDNAHDQVLDRAELVSGRQEGQRRHLQLRHQARQGRATNAKISWTQVETGSAITWKYPSCILQGDNSVGEFYSVALDEQLSAGRHRHEDDSHRQEHAQSRSSRRASPPATVRTPTAAW